MELSPAPRLASMSYFEKFSFAVRCAWVGATRSTRSVDLNLARRFNAGIKSPASSRRYATIETSCNFKRRYATRTSLAHPVPAVETPG